jgi:hypothetical protein
MSTALSVPVTRLAVRRRSRGPPRRRGSRRRRRRRPERVEKLVVHTDAPRLTLRRRRLTRAHAGSSDTRDCHAVGRSPEKTRPAPLACGGIGRPPPLVVVAGTIRAGDLGSRDRGRSVRCLLAGSHRAPAARRAPRLRPRSPARGPPPRARHPAAAHAPLENSSQRFSSNASSSSLSTVSRSMSTAAMRSSCSRAR